MQISPLCDEDMVDTRMAIEGVTYMYNSIVLLEACGNIYILYSRIRCRYLYKKHTTTGYADSFLKALNAKETFHAHLVSTRTLCNSSTHRI